VLNVGINCGGSGIGMAKDRARKRERFAP
jgi:hypothetical protein